MTTKQVEWPDYVTWPQITNGQSYESSATYADLFAFRADGTGPMDNYNYKKALTAIEAKLTNHFPDGTMLERLNYLSAVACTKGGLIEVGGPTNRYDSPLKPVEQVETIDTRSIQVLNVLKVPGIAAQADGGRLPCKNKSLGLVVASCLPTGTREQLFAESERCLEPGGILAYQRANDLDVSYILSRGFSMLGYARLPRTDLGEIFNVHNRLWTFVAQRP